MTQRPIKDINTSMPNFHQSVFSALGSSPSSRPLSVSPRYLRERLTRQPAWPSHSGCTYRVRPGYGQGGICPGTANYSGSLQAAQLRRVHRLTLPPPLSY